MSSTHQEILTVASCAVPETPTAVRATSAEIDRIVGRRLRSLRLGRGLTQQQLARDLGVSFQQLQKYESGSNRIAASKLWMLGKLLSVDISLFFDDLQPKPKVESEIQADALEAAVLLSSIPDAATRQSIVDMIKVCSKAK